MGQYIYDTFTLTKQSFAEQSEQGGRKSEPKEACISRETFC